MKKILSLLTRVVVWLVWPACAAFACDLLPYYTTMNVNGTVSFTNGTVAATSYWWDFGDGEVSDEFNPVHVYSAIGAYNVCVTAYDSVQSCSETYCALVPISSVNVSTYPEADFTYTQEGNTITFNNVSNGFTQYAWAMDDGNQLFEENPIHTFDMPGAYLVCLFAANFETYSFDTYCEEIMIDCNDAVQAGFTYSVNEYTVLFNSNSIGANFWEWSVGDMLLYGDGNGYVYDEPGVYSVCLYVENLNTTCFDEVCQEVLVTGEPSIVVQEMLLADFNYTVNEQVVTFENISTGADMYSWQLTPDSSVLADAPVFTYQEEGTYTVCLTAVNSSSMAFDTYCADVVIGCVDASVQAQFDYVVDGAGVTFTNLSANADAFVWQFDELGTSNEVDAMYTFDSNGSYLVCLQAVNTAIACDDLFCQMVSIVLPEILNANFTYEVEGLTASFTNISTGASTFLWTILPDVETTGPGLTYAFDSPGVYEVCLTAFDEVNFLYSTVCQNVLVPVIICDINANFTAEMNEYMLNCTNLSVGGVSQMLWSFGDGNTSNEINPEHVYDTTGVFTVNLQVVDEYDYCTDEFNLTVSIEAPCDIIALFDTTIDELNVAFENVGAGNATQYLWNFGDGNTSEEISPTYQYANSGVYWVSLMATNNSGDCTNSYGSWVSVLFPKQTYISKLLVNECGAPAGSQELLLFHVGENEINLSEVEVDWPSGIWAGLCQNEAIVTAMNDMVAADGGFVAPTAGVLPAYAKVLLFTSENVNYNNYDFSGINDTWYVLFQCGNVMPGHLPNNPTGIRTVKLKTSDTGLTSVTYNLSLLTGADGDYVRFLPNEIPQGGNDGCVPITANDELCTLVADFSYNVNGLQVTFNQQSVGAFNVMSWSFGDGPAVAIEENLTHVYPNAGDYYVCLTVLNTANSCLDITCKNVSVTNQNDDPVDIDIEGGNRVLSNTPNQLVPVETLNQYIEKKAINIGGCAMDVAFEYEVEGLNIQFTNKSEGDFNRVQWYFGDGNESTEMHPKHVYEKEGMYTFTLTLTNTNQKCRKHFSGQMYVFGE